MLLLADGHSYSTVYVGMTDRFVARWKRCFATGGVLALADDVLADDTHAGRQDYRLSPAVEARILCIIRDERPPMPLTHWTSRWLAARVSVSNAAVLPVWCRTGLKPHRLEHYVATSDPEFDWKAADIIVLYLEPPEHVVLCVNEETTIQALDRVEPVLPLSPGHAECHGFNYVRHGNSRSTPPSR